MTKNAGRFFIMGLFLALVVIIADQYTKWLVMETVLRANPTMVGFQEWFMTRNPVDFFLDQREAYNTLAVTPFLNLVMVWNQGISFGMLSSADDAQMMTSVLIGVSVMISMVMLIWMALTTRAVSAVALGLIIGGAIGNVIDRIRFGAVADFVDVYVGDWHWPAFNLADSTIVIGALLLMIDVIRAPDKDKQEKQA